MQVCCAEAWGWYHSSEAVAQFRVSVFAQTDLLGHHETCSSYATQRRHDYSHKAPKAAESEIEEFQEQKRVS